MAQLWRRMRTQTEAYWQEWQVGEDDIEYLYSSFLESESPRSTDELALSLMRRHVEQEEQRLIREADRGPIYRPQERYTIGQQLVFPALNRASGEVVSQRPGRNPKYGPFTVIGVKMEGEDRVREFASEFALPHPLNQTMEEILSESEDRLAAEELYARYGHYVRDKLATYLKKDAEFVALEQGWFIRSLLPEINIGHLNIAEALIAMAQRPLSTDALLQEVGLETTLSREVQRAALEVALDADERFDKIEAGEERRWFLYDLEPEAVVRVPSMLRPAYQPPEHGYILGELAEYVREIGDELDERAGLTVPTNATGSVSFVLNYPHWREGTVPLTRAIRQLLPPDAGERYPLTLRVGDLSLPGWVLAGRKYIWGLQNWYREQDLPVGATVNVARTDDPYTLQVSYERRPRRGEWVREAKVMDGRLVFEMQKRAYTCRYDRYLLFDVSQQAEVDALALRYTETHKPLHDLILEIVPELIKLSSQGVFQAKTLYAAVNLVQRSGALPIFVELTRWPCFDPVGAGNWAYDPTTKDVFYGLEEEMRERPYSQRADLIKDIVVSF